MTRVFTVEVTGCKDCPHHTKGEITYCKHGKIWAETYKRKIEIRCLNFEAVTKSCPMYQHSFVKDEKK